MLRLPISLTVAVVFVLFISGGTAVGSEQPAAESATQEPIRVAAPPATRPATTQPATTAPIENVEPAYVQFTTNKGSFVLELNREKAPITVDNFLKYVDSDFYDNTIFHRVVKGGINVIQGGGMSADQTPKKTNPPIKNEWRNGLKNERGTISMARTSVHDSATSQFFINVQANTALDQPNDGAAYAVFGKIVAGMNTIDALYATPVQPNPAMRNENSQPVEPLIVQKAERIDAEKVKDLLAPPEKQSPTKGASKPPVTEEQSTKPVNLSP